MKAAIGLYASYEVQNFVRSAISAGLVGPLWRRLTFGNF